MHAARSWCRVLVLHMPVRVLTTKPGAGSQHGRHGAPDGAVLAPNFNANRLVLPVVAPVATDSSVNDLVRIVPSAHALGFAGFIYNPLPRDDALLAGIDKLAAYLVGGCLAHVRDQAQREQAIANGADGG